MKRFIARILSVNPLLSLGLVLAYVACLWVGTFKLWNSGNALLAVVFLFGVSWFVKSKSRSIIAEIKRIKSFDA